MPIVMVRVDDRLIHGQILETWLPTTRAQELVVANDELAHDDTQRTIIEAIVPRGVSLIIDSVAGVAKLLQEGDNGSAKRIVIVDSPVDALRLIRAGVVFERLNLGNMRSGASRVCLSSTVFAGDTSIRALCEIYREGIRVEIQPVPFEQPVDLFKAHEWLNKVMSTSVNNSAPKE